MIGLHDLRGLSGPGASVTGKPATRGKQRLMCCCWGCERGIIKNLLTHNKSVSSGKIICHFSVAAGVTASFGTTTSWRWYLGRLWLGVIWNKEGIGHQSCVLHCDSCHQELWRNAAAMSVPFLWVSEVVATAEPQQRISLCGLRKGWLLLLLSHYSITARGNGAWSDSWPFLPISQCAEDNRACES